MRGRGEEGWALITALMLMTIMAGFGLATMALVDGQQEASAEGRQRETAFNVAEAALNAQTYQLARSWPGYGGQANAALRYPASCTEQSTDPRCPTSATLIALYASVDATPNATWTTYVRDNSGSPGAETFWNEAMVSTAPAYDYNDDGKLWVRSESVVRGRRRAMVSLVRTEPQGEDMPRVALLSGRLALGNRGNKELVDTRGPSASTGPVQVRCTPVEGESAACLGHAISGGIDSLEELIALLDVQISPNESETGYAGGDAMTAEQIARLKATAISDGTYYTSCPASLAGDVVFVETTASCQYTGNTVYNTEDEPGAVIMTGGTMTIGGGITYYGVVYHTNAADLTSTLVTVTGSARVQGGVVIDGDATLSAGNSGGAKVNVVFDDRAFSSVTSRGGAGLVQNTWREIR